LSEDPALEHSFHAWLDLFYAETVLPPRLMEICRLRAAFHAQCPHCMYHRFTDPGDTGIDEALVCSLEKPEEAQGLSERERSALRYVDLIAANRHQEITGATFADLRAHFSEREVVELGLFLGAVHGQQRIRGALRLDIDELPADYQAAAGSIRFAGDGKLRLRPPGRNAGAGSGDGDGNADGDGDGDGDGADGGAGAGAASAVSAVPADEARPAGLPRSQFPDVYRDFTAGIPDDQLGLRHIYARAPEIAIGWERYADGLMAGGSLPLRLKELVLLRLALWHENGPEIAAGRRAGDVDDVTFRSLQPPYDPLLLGPAELAALRYADLLCGDHFSITEEELEELGRSLSRAELSDLGQFLASHAIQVRVTAGWAGPDAVS
jgi:alkylhydroperoxidase family enzyme